MKILINCTKFFIRRVLKSHIFGRGFQGIFWAFHKLTLLHSFINFNHKHWNTSISLSRIIWLNLKNSFKWVVLPPKIWHNYIVVLLFKKYFSGRQELTRIRYSSSVQQTGKLLYCAFSLSPTFYLIKTIHLNSQLDHLSEGPVAKGTWDAASFCGCLIEKVVSTVIGKVYWKLNIMSSKTVILNAGDGWW